MFIKYFRKSVRKNAHWAAQGLRQKLDIEKLFLEDTKIL